jgi:hypothetical protein
VWNFTPKTSMGDLSPLGMGEGTLTVTDSILTETPALVSILPASWNSRTVSCPRWAKVRSMAVAGLAGGCSAS